MADAKLCLIDANSLFYRAFYAIKADLATSSGQPTNAVFGFVKMVNRILEELAPEYLGVCFDVGKKTHRTEKFAEYKIHRSPMPDALVSQVPLIKEVVAAYSFASFEAQGFEADDVIATLVHRMEKKVDKTVIVSSDKDMLQLVSDDVEVYNPYKEGGIVFTEALVKEKFGVEPKRIADLIALMGDASDNIPGAHGIGEKTARELLQDFKGAEDLIKNSSKIKREAVRSIIENNREAIRMSRELALLRNDVPLDADLKTLKLRPPDTQKLWEVFARLEFKGMLKELSQERLSISGGLATAIPTLSFSDVGEILAKIARQKIFSFFIDEDTAGTAFKVNIALGDEGVYQTDDISFLKKVFAQKAWVAIGHDVKAAQRIFRQHGIPFEVKFFDTMLAAYLTQSSRASRDLESLLWDFLSLKGVSRQDYLGKESHFLFRLKSVLEKELKAKDLLGLFGEVEMPLVDVLAEMEETGIAIDIDGLKEFSRQMEKKLDRLIHKIYEMAGCEFNINSPKQLGDVLFNKLKLPVVKKTKTGVSTDEEVLTKLSRDNELPRILLEYRQVTKLVTTYIDVLPDLADKKTGRIHSHFNQTGTETGRLSSNNPNLQNIPIKTELGRRIRQAFIPGKGFDEILSADYSQIELRILAHLSLDPALIKAFQDDTDIHRFTASLIFGADEKDVTDEMRNNAKRVNFGIIYGMSSYGLAKDLGIDARTAQAFIDEYFLRYPKVKAYLDTQVDFVKKNGYVTTLLGRRRYIPEIVNANMAVRQFAERQAINAPIQGSAADLIKLAMVHLHERLQEGGFQSRLLLQVHDELVFEVKKSEKKDLIKLVRSQMEQAIPLRVPVKTTISTGKNWLDTQEVEE
jgi:DNA polymerase-1